VDCAVVIGYIISHYCITFYFQQHVSILDMLAVSFLFIWFDWKYTNERVMSTKTVVKIHSVFYNLLSFGFCLNIQMYAPVWFF